MHVDVFHKGRAVANTLRPGEERALYMSRGDFVSLNSYIGEDGRSYRDVWTGLVDNSGRKLYRPEVTNAPSLMPKEGWVQLRREIQEVAIPRLQVFSDFMSLGLREGIDDPFGTTVIQHQKVGTAGSATRSMDLLRRSNNDRQEIEWDGLPVPFTHGEFSGTFRELAVSRRAGMPFDRGMLREETRRISELTEDWLLGTVSGFPYAGYVAYGLTNHPDTISASMTLPTDAGWDPETTYNELLGIFQSLRDLQFYGPYGVYFSPDWAQYMQKKYSAAYDAGTLATQLNNFQDVRFFRQADRLGSGFKMIVFKIDKQYVGVYDGLPITPVQWTNGDGMELNWKLYCCQFPRIVSDASGNLPVVYAVAA